jgi:hypothetical protein
VGGLLTFLSCKLTFLSCKLTFLSCKLTFLSSKLTFLSSELTFLSSELTFLSSKLTGPGCRLLPSPSVGSSPYIPIATLQVRWASTHSREYTLATSMYGGLVLTVGAYRSAVLVTSWRSKMQRSSINRCLHILLTAVYPLWLAVAALAALLSAPL